MILKTPKASLISDYDSRLLGLLLTPSTLSGTLSVVAGVGTTLATIITAHYRGSYAELAFFNYRVTQANKSLVSAYGYGAQDTGSRIINNIPLLLFWLLVGFVVYTLAVSVVSALQSANEMKDELEDYVNIDRRGLLRTAALHFAIRLVAIAIWIPYTIFFLHRILPYCMATSLASASSPFSVAGILYFLLASIVMILAVHVHVVLFRFLMLKPRVFSGALYVD